MTKILVTAKVNPDIDGTACTFAYAELLRLQGIDAKGIVFGSPQSEVQYFIEKHQVTIPTAQDTKGANWDKFVLVDFPEVKGMPNCVKSEDVIEVIDHRKSEPEKDYPNAKIQNDLIGAASTLVVERFIKAGKKPHPDHAKLLYGAIFHNTLNFIASNADVRDKHAVFYLEKEFGFTKAIIREMFDFSTKEIEKNILQALENDAKEFGTGWKIGAYQLIVWGEGILQDKQLIAKSIKALAEKMGSHWALLNIVNLEKGESIVFVTDKTYEQVLNKALGAVFHEGIAILPRALLRKQIMPLVNDTIKNLTMA